ncbi:hypothetical protein [Brevibacillus centrosporus]|uniref:Uncharacterized protein n=1 Tax=Brevibacillus centrosporus TaxID=54910 RepID=A0A1I3MIY6_9BACL|nr:hypothetical protein [Brevibacillus centrosporus]MEC2132938.1 hypothetical protein [Brevibacillus centrosporus]MED4911843.1 hypothetical protein [Brevibacillus centrosporus]GED34063.1 hypothetical protein BCE02nite_52040 [Brevibacillus centrosporus]SFI96902.1 hypothetical protein SAMN05518846_101637 [Brevibacillus centrosporus]
MKNKIADSMLSKSKPQPVQVESEEQVREALLGQVLTNTMLDEETVKKQKDRYLLERK